jgi:trehalose/maltose hydrolase-like predicted phosphorylase
VPHSRIEALVLVAPDELGSTIHREARALVRTGVIVRTVPRHRSPRLARTVADIWLTDGVRPSEIVAIDGCEGGCPLPHGVVGVARGLAASVLSDATIARARGHLPVIPDDPIWTVEVVGADPALEWMHDSWLAMVDGVIGTQGSPLAVYPPARREVMVGGVYSGIGPATDALRVPDWTRLGGRLQADEPIRRVLDMRTGFVHHEATSTLGGYRAITFASRTMPGLGVLRAQGGGARSPADGPLAVAPGRVPSKGRTTAPGRAQPDGRPTVAEVGAERGGVVVAARQTASGSGSTRRLDRLSAYRTGPRRRPSVRAALGMLRKAERQGIESLISDQRSAWARRWAEMGIAVDSDPELQRAIAFSLYHLDASIANQPEAPLGPRGLTGPSYKAHVFWDSECYVLPFFAATRPAAARAMLTYRARRIEPARQAAKEAGFAGAWFPWESAADGRDVTPTWVHGDDAVPIRVWTGERELHVVADIAWAVDHYVAWSGDTRFAATDGLRILVESARFWASRLERDPDGSAHLRGVIGPDEYHELVDDNAFTNVMARWNLRAAAAAVRRYAGAGGRTTGVRTRGSRLEPPDRGELEDWEKVAAAIVDGYDPKTRIYEQFEGFEQLEPLRIAELSARPVPGDVLLGRERVAHAQVVKQADVLLLHHFVPDEVAPGSLVPNLDFYEPRTSHGSSLSPGAHATLLARAGRMDAALETLGMTAFMDLDDRSGKAAEGLHIPTMGALWQALVMGFGGIRPVGDALAVDPALPAAWSQLEIPLRFRGRRLRVTITDERVVVRGSVGIAVSVPGTGSITLTGRRLELRRREDGWEPVTGVRQGAQAPRKGAKTRPPTGSSSSPRSLTTRDAPAASSSRRKPARSTPRTKPKPPRAPASTPARASSTTAVRETAEPSSRAASTNTAGCGLPGRFDRTASMPSTLASNRSSTPAASRTWVAFLLAEMTATRRSAARRRSTKSMVVPNGSTPFVTTSRTNSSFLRLPRPATVSRSGLSSGLPSGRTIPRDARKSRTPSSRRLPSTKRR